MLDLREVFGLRVGDQVDVIVGDGLGVIIEPEARARQVTIRLLALGVELDGLRIGVDGLVILAVVVGLVARRQRRSVLTRRRLLWRGLWGGLVALVISGLLLSERWRA